MCNIDVTRWIEQVLAVLAQPFFIFFMYKSLKWLVVANVDRLHDASAARQDDNYLNTKVVDCAIHRSHLVDPIDIANKRAMIPLALLQSVV